MTQGSLTILFAEKMRTLVLLLAHLFLVEASQAMTEEEFSEWNQKHRQFAIDYLEKEGIQDPQVAPFPAFDMAPHFAI